MIARPTRRVSRLKLTGHDARIGRSFHEAERRFNAVAAARKDLVSLTHVDMARFPAPPEAVSGLIGAVEDNVEVFTAFHGDPGIRRQLAPRIEEFLGVQVDPDAELAITPGTQSALFSVMAALIETGDRVLLPDPDYVSSERMIRFLGGEVVYARQVLEETGLSLDLDELRAAFRGGVRLVVFSHPCNPTGAVYGPEFLAELAGLVVEFDAYVIVDELYARLVYDKPFHHLAAQPGMRERCITTLGTSKFESMSGYRIGCVVAPAPIIHELIDIVSITSLRASGYAQHALGGWLGADREFMADRLDTFRQLRSVTVDYFASLPFVDLIPPDGTAYVFPRVRGARLDDFEVCERIVEEAGVLVYPGISFGPGGAGGFRLCFAQDESKLPGYLEQIGATLQRLV